MFFQETKDYFLSDTVIPSVFFDQILPVIHSEHSKVYLYGYFLSLNRDISEMTDNKILASKLKMELDQVLEAWDFLESCGLIRKHRAEDALAWDYAVEFLDLKSIYMNKAQTRSAVSTDEMVLLAKNSYLRAMFDSIESITKKTLNYNDIRTINEFMKEYSVAKELVIEAFSFSVSIKKSKTVSSALGILRSWYLDGIRNVEDLRLHLENKHKRYTQYRQILSFLGEYRLPTAPEKKLMDSWLDAMGFSMEVIESAVGKSISIKNPNMNYVNGILKNWHKKYTALPNQRRANTFRANKLSELEFRTAVIQSLGQREQILSQQEDRYLTELYNSFSLEDIQVAINYLKTKQHLPKEELDAGKYKTEGITSSSISLEGLTRFLIQPSSRNNSPAHTNISEDSKIQIEDLKEIIAEKSKPPVNSKTPAGTASDDELEKRLIQKRETINKQAEMNKIEK